MSAVATHSASLSKSRPLTPQYYLEIIKKTSNFNSHLASERKQRLPFIDSQTGVAQHHTNLWHPYRARGPGEGPEQIYSYPARRWKKKKRSFPLPEIRLTKLTDMETGEAGSPAPPTKSSHKSPAKARVPLAAKDASNVNDMHQISAVENPAASGKEEYKDGYEESYKESYQYQYYDDWEGLDEQPDAGEIDARHSDSSDFEDTYIKRKKKKPKNKGGRGRKKDMKEPLDDADKPYSCDHCGARYKTRPGLSYHVTHSHNMPKKKDVKERESRESKEKEREREREREAPPPAFQDTPPASIGYDDDTSCDMDYTSSGGKSRATTGRAAAAAANAAMTVTSTTQSEISKYCDFCLGDALENKKTGDKEELVSCADCGRSGHPSCLQFTPNMIISVKKYPWQCIECKSCGLCGTSDNDDQLLFCDDCDRGYHMYCLKPPLSEPPEGSWSCHLCVIEFYGGKKEANGDAAPTTTVL